MFRLFNLLSGSRFVLKMATLTVAFGALACGSDAVGPGGNDADLMGTHQMVTINSHDVPHTFTDLKGSKLTIFGGSLSLRADGTYELTYQGTLNANGFDLSDQGIYSISGQVVAFQSDDDEFYNASIQDGTLALSRKVAGVMFSMGFKVD